MCKLLLVTAAAIALDTVSAFADMQSLTKDVRFRPCWAEEHERTLASLNNGRPPYPVKWKGCIWLKQVNEVFGRTRNPWNTALTAGGSTGGGASALASGMIALVEGTDLGGSLRIPASFCGVVGLRPSPGLVPTVPSPLPWNDMQVTGAMARTAED